MSMHVQTRWSPCPSPPPKRHYTTLWRLVAKKIYCKRHEELKQSARPSRSSTDTSELINDETSAASEHLPFHCVDALTADMMLYDGYCCAEDRFITVETRGPAILLKKLFGWVYLPPLPSVIDTVFRPTFCLEF